MENKFTPGPWSWELKSGNREARISYHDFGFAEVFINPSADDTEEIEANAKLIAEAPSMLKTLQEIFEFTKGKPIGSNEYQIHMLCYSTINKATT